MCLFIIIISKIMRMCLFCFVKECLSWFLSSKEQNRSNSPVKCTIFYSVMLGNTNRILKGITGNSSSSAICEQKPWNKCSIILYWNKIISLNAGHIFSSLYCSVRTQIHIDHCHHYHHKSHKFRNIHLQIFVSCFVLLYTRFFLLLNLYTLFYSFYLLFTLSYIEYVVKKYYVFIFIFANHLEDINFIFLALLIITFKFKIFFILK